MMTNKQTVFNWPKVQNPREAMCPDVLSIETYFTISILDPMQLPFPTRAISISLDQNIRFVKHVDSLL